MYNRRIEMQIHIRVRGIAKAGALWAPAFAISAKEKYSPYGTFSGCGYFLQNINFLTGTVYLQDIFHSSKYL